MTVNTQELRELAEKATPGPWKSVDREVLEDNSVYPAHIVGGSADYQVALMESPTLAKLATESAPGSWPYNRRAIDANSAYIAAVNPSTVSALLDEIDALRAELQARQWQPIESAPRDGTLILLGRGPIEDCDAISVPGYWQEGWDDSIDDMGCDSGFVDVHFQEFSGGRSFGAEKYRCASNQPTHWMPLPPAPPQGDGA